MLTYDRIEKMSAGPEMDAAVASLLGWKHCENDPEASAELLVSQGHTMMHPPGGRSDCIVFAQFVPSFSTDIGSAWKVFVALLTNFGRAAIIGDMEHFGRGAITAGKADQVVTVEAGDWSATGPVCEAICRVALLMANAPA